MRWRICYQNLILFPRVYRVCEIGMTRRKERKMAEAYCVRCKKKTTMKNGRHAMKGTCAVCGTSVQTFLSEKKAVK